MKIYRFVGSAFRLPAGDSGNAAQQTKEKPHYENQE